MPGTGDDITDAGPRRRIGLALSRLRRRIPPDPPDPAEPLEDPGLDPSALLTKHDMGDSPRNRALLAAIDRHLDGRAAPRIAVLMDSTEPPKLANLLRERVPSATVVVVPVDSEESSQHLALTAAGRLHLIVDDTRLPDRARLFRATFHHLGKGGAYVVRNFRAAHGGSLSYVARLVEAKGRRVPGSATTQQRDDAALAESISTVDVDRQHFLVRHRGQVLAKVTEAQMTRLLELHPERGRLLAVEPPVELRSRAKLVESDSTRAGVLLPDRYEPLPASLRAYDDVVCRPGQVATQKNTVLPDSFRRIARFRLDNKRLEDVAPWFARVPEPVAPRPLPGSYYYLDSEWRGHFGHAMTEQVSRLWGWERAKRADPDLKVLMTIKNHEPAQFEFDLFGAAGIPEEDLVMVREPVRVERLVAATPLFSMPYYVHPMIEKTWNQLGRALDARASDREYPERIFLARRQQTERRLCRNASEVEQLFASHGFEIVYAEDMPIADQARMFRRAKAVGGLTGSALTTICLAEEPKDVFVITSESFISVNEYMISAVRGHALTMAYCTPEIPMPEGRWSKKAFASPFSVNWDHEGQFLKEQLERL